MTNKNNNKPIPPIIEALIEKMSDTSTNLYLRDNYCATLENIRDRCADAIQNFNIEKISKEKKRA